MSRRPQPRNPHRAPRPQPAAAAPAVLVQIEKPIYGGAFLARLEGKAVFVPLALSGEQARVRVVESRKGWAAAEIEAIVEPSTERIEPRCPVFGQCGGCSYQHTSHENQIELKRAILRETLERAGVPAPAEIDVLSAGPWRYRNRVRFAFDAEGRWGFRGRRSHAVVAINDCPLAAPLLVDAARAFAELRAALTPALRVTELALFATGDEGALIATVLVSAIPNRHLFEKLAEAWQERVPALIGVELAVQTPAEKFPRRLAVFCEDALNYTAAGQEYRVDHGAFFQVNRFLVDALVERVTAGRAGHMAWDLFAGVGLFARSLATQFERVVAVEAAPTALPGLKANLPGTGAAVRADTLAFLERRAAGERPDLVVVDPPRAGLGPEVCQHLIEVGAPQMVSVSCDPATLARDLKLLTAGGYNIERVTLADLFPQTCHLETVVDLRRA